ncbi:MAG: Na(+)-translocating NADH-quinone reductase subunit A [Bacteroidetes bacterium]|nr:Na(+)-translocating NADH-quinone reductase subunit A [Bacteroidota bacterium]MDA1336395.1 Na(+)-translocating NADH-quinone reductase subunit A [Bacteroidota bacterium]
MSRTIRIKKGADIRLKGRPTSNHEVVPMTATYAVQPPDYQGIVPKLEVKEGAAVEAGSVLFHSKEHPESKFLSPISGAVKAIIRGEKRRILSVVIDGDGKQNAKNFGTLDVGSLSPNEMVAELQKRGFMAFMEQRPFATVADPSELPRSIHISGFESAPLAPDMGVVLNGRMDSFQQGIDALRVVVGGQPVHLGVRAGQTDFDSITGVERYVFQGPHPAGNVGVQIHHTAPVNKGEVVWSMHPEDVANLGESIKTGTYIAKRTISVAGSSCSSPGHASVTLGCEVAGLLGPDFDESEDRAISGNPLTGVRVNREGHMGGLHRQLTLLPEGNKPKFLLTEGWLGLGFDKFSLSKSYPTWLLPKSKEFTMDTCNNGEERAFVVTGQYEAVFPFDIYPVHLLKSILANDIDAMEKLGIYEVAPEDFALCEYACTSKIGVQSLVREGLDRLKKELG